MQIYSCTVQNENDILYIHAEFIGAALQKARRLTRLLFQSTAQVRLRVVKVPTQQQSLLASQMAVLLGEPVPKELEKSSPAQPQTPSVDDLWLQLTNSLNEAGLL